LAYREACESPALSSQIRTLAKSASSSSFHVSPAVCLFPGFPLFAEAMPLTRRPQFCVTFAPFPFIYIAPSGTWANPGPSTSLCAAFSLFAFFVPHFHIINFIGPRLIYLKYSKNTRNIIASFFSHKESKQNSQNSAVAISKTKIRKEKKTLADSIYSIIL
jgi:hypothetical protein